VKPQNQLLLPFRDQLAKIEEKEPLSLSLKKPFLSGTVSIGMDKRQQIKEAMTGTPTVLNLFAKKKQRSRVGCLVDCFPLDQQQCVITTRNNTKATNKEEPRPMV